jgi:hypothetical protein
MTRRTAIATTAGACLRTPCPTCTTLARGSLTCIGCGRKVAAATGDPVFDLGTQRIVGHPQGPPPEDWRGQGWRR